MKNFFRKVAFGLKPDEKIPSDPLVWATSQITDEIPDFSFKGKIYSEKELRKHYREWVFNDRKKLRKKFKKVKKYDPSCFKPSKFGMLVNTCLDQ